MTNSDTKTPQKKAARIAGFMYLFIILSSLLALAVLDPKINTIKDIMANEIYFRINTAYTLIMYLSVIILTVYLFAILKHVDKNLAILALSFRLGEAILGGVKVLCCLIVLLLLEDKSYSKIFGAEHLQSLAGLFSNAYWSMTIVVFAFLGLGSIVYFYLFYKSKYIPKILSVLGMCSYSLVVTGSFISIVFSNNAFMILGSQAILFEIVIGGWLLFKGIDLKES